ncbi:hypothetical protein [Alistipes putredinis]|uniref:beta barrel domain-containing protein n=1 Tax=Alistipes putredinis TaxID=28117 RepID=UPI003AB7A312
MKIKDFTVGQTAYLLESKQGRFEGTDRIKKVNVLKVGRVYVTIDNYGRRFELLGSRDPYLYEAPPITNSAKLFLTYDDAVDEIKRETLIRKIHSAPFKSICDCTLAQLEQIDDILFSDKEGER